MNNHHDAEEIDRIGADVIRAHFGISRQAVHYWKRHGVPQRHRNSLAALERTIVDGDAE